jgi:UDP-glucose 4-epimerase
MILLVGGNGFLGRHVRTLLTKDAQCVCIVSRRVEPVAANEQFVQLEKFAAPEGDAIITQASSIVYLATRSVPATFASQPAEEVAANVEPATTFFARSTALNPKAKIVLISSGGTIYGNAGPQPVTENVPARPISAYGLGKLMIEEALQFFGRASGRPYTILRVSNPVGKFHLGSAQGLIPIALRCLQEGTPLPLVGGGRQVRDYVDADDVAEAIITACRSDIHRSNVWNVGSGNGYSVRTVIELIERVTGKTMPVHERPKRSFDVETIVLDISKIRTELGWEPQSNLIESIERVWHFSKRKTD